MTEIRIHRLTEDQTLQALPALAAILVDCVEGGASVGFLSPYTEADARVFWDGVRTAVAEQATVLLVAEVDGDILGTVQLGIKLPPNQPHRADLKKLLVHRRGRGLGIGRALMEAAEAEALGIGKHILVLDTATQSPAEAIYERLGWVRAGVIPDYAMMPDGSYCGSTFFYKRLETGAHA